MFDGDRHVGRIMLHPQNAGGATAALETIARERKPQTTYDRGYAATALVTWVGAYVAPDQALAKIDPQEQEANLRAAEANVQAAEAQSFDR